MLPPTHTNNIWGIMGVHRRVTFGRCRKRVFGTCRVGRWVFRRWRWWWWWWLSEVLLQDDNDGDDTGGNNKNCYLIFLTKSQFDALLHIKNKTTEHPSLKKKKSCKKTRTHPPPQTQKTSLGLAWVFQGGRRWWSKSSTLKEEVSGWQRQNRWSGGGGKIKEFWWRILA